MHFTLLLVVSTFFFGSSVGALLVSVFYASLRVRWLEEVEKELWCALHAQNRNSPNMNVWVMQPVEDEVLQFDSEVVAVHDASYLVQ